MRAAWTRSGACTNGSTTHRWGATRRAPGRESLARLLADPRVALAVLSGDDVALTAYGTARVIDERIIDAVVAVEIAVERVQDHRRDTFVIEAGVRWRWTDPAAQQRDSEVRIALARLAQR